MPLIVSEARGDAAGTPEIVVHSVGSDGMEINRDFLSLAEAERHIAAIRPAIERCRARTAIHRGHPAGTGSTALPPDGRRRDRRGIPGRTATSAGTRPGRFADRPAAVSGHIRATGRELSPTPPFANCPGS